MSNEKWKLARLAELRTEAQRLLTRIDAAETTARYNPDRNWSAVKRASLDLNCVGARLRAGQYRDEERNG